MTDFKIGHIKGPKGRGIQSLTIKANGVLQVNYDDGTNVDVGKVVGEDGLDGASGIPIKQEMTVQDTVAELLPNRLYIFPEMPTLTYTLGAEDAGVTNEYHFIFQSGATPTEVVHPSGVNVGSLTVEANKIYEISVMENMLAYQSWAVN